MRTGPMSRRTVLEAGVCAMAAPAAIPGIAAAHAETGLSPNKQETIRKYYAAWETRDWHPVDILLADNFTLRAQTTTTTSVRALSKRAAGSRRSIL